MTELNPTTTEEQIPAEDSQKSRNASRIASTIFYSSLAATLFVIFLAWQSRAWQLYTVVAIAFVNVALVYSGLRAVRRGRTRTGMLISINGPALVLPFMTLVVSDIGLVLGIAIASTAYFYATQTMAAKDTRRITLANIVIGILVAATDFLTLEYRLQVPALQAFTPVLVAVVFLTIGFFIIRRAMQGNIRTKLLTAFIGVTVVATGAAGVFAFVTINNNLRDSLERELSGEAVDRATRIGDLFKEQTNTLTTISLNKVLQDAANVSNQSYMGDATAIQAEIDAKDAQWRAADAADNNADPLVRENLTNEVASELKQFQGVFPNHVEVFVTDVYGSLIGATNRTSDYYQADEGWWQAAYNDGTGAVYIGTPEFDESAGAIGVQIALPLRSHASDEIVGILRTTYIISPLTTILTEKLGETGELDVYFPGEAVTHIHEGEFGLAKAEEFEALQAVFGQGLVEMEYEGVPSVVTQAQVQTLEGNPAVDNLGWVVVLHQQQDEAFAPVTTATRGFIIVLVVIVALAAAAAFGFSSVLVRPILQLTTTAEEVSAGDLSSRAEVTTADEVGTLATTFNNMTAQLQETLGGLEQRVADRTRDLAIVAEVGTATATILESQRLLQEVVDLTKERFNLYHSHIYLLDEKGQNLVLAAGAGEPGRVMVAKGHSIPQDREQSLVARAARERQGVTVNDVSQAPDHLPNPLLPDTRSELAVPMIVGGNVIGVFDIQSEQVGRFTESDINIQTTLAAQLAVSIQNVRSFEQSKKQADFESLVNVIGQKIQRTTTMEETLQTAIRELGSAIGASRVRVSLKPASDVGTTEIISPPEPRKAVLERDGQTHEGNSSAQVV